MESLDNLEPFDDLEDWSDDIGLFIEAICRPHTPLDLLGEGAKADCSEDQFDQYLTATSPNADKIVDSLSRP